MRRLCLALATLTLSACAQMPTPTPVPRGGISSSVEPAPARTLYRVRYEGPDGGGSLRLVVRQVAADRFQLQASDTFGRAVWSLDLDGDDVLLVNHRERQACVAGGELRVPELALRPLPLPAVARVLAARTPVRVPAGADRSDWTDETGRRWTASWEGDRLEAWTLWQEGEPRLSWRRQGRGGVLSHLAGSQFRWRQVTREKLQPSTYRRLEAPADYRFGECRSEAAPG